MLRDDTAIVVLAAPNDEEGCLSEIAVERLKAAAAILKRQPQLRLILTGGFGAHFNTTDRPHYEYAHQHLLDHHGVSESRFLVSLCTSHTYHDVLFARTAAGHHGLRELIFVTSDYHAARVRYLLELVMPNVHTVVCEVTHRAVSADRLQLLRAHDRTALSKTIAATILFGIDRLPHRSLCRRVYANAEEWVLLPQ